MMERLTTTKKLEPEFFKNLKDVDENKYFLKVDKSYEDTIEAVADKLGQLEDIEEELGIDLITLFKALKNGIYHKNENNIIEFDSDIEFNYGYYADESTPKTYYFVGDEMYLFNEYGKKWALTSEELENDK